MKKRILLLVALCLSVGSEQPVSAQPQSPSRILHVAIVADGPWERNREYFDFIEKEVVDVSAQLKIKMAK